jgi:type IV/VI secretion system ImpK/VasF family protein
MENTFAAVVMPLFSKVLDLVDRLEHENSLELEQVLLQTRKLIEEADRRMLPFPQHKVDYDELGSADERSRSVPSSRRAVQLGARFALVAWIDELLTNSSWGEKVGYGIAEHHLEWTLYRSRERSNLFYQSAKLAQKQERLDCLEVHLLCVTLGFIGDFREDSEGFTQWVAEMYALVSRNSGNASLEEVKGEPVKQLAPRDGALILWTTSVLLSATAILTLLTYFLSVYFKVQ